MENISLENVTVLFYTEEDIYRKSHDFYLYFIGSAWASDAISLFIMPIVIILSIILNFFGFLVIQLNSEFSVNMYYYLKIFFLNSLFSNIIGVLIPFINSHRFISFGNTWFAVFYLSKIGAPIINTSYFFNNMIDIYMAFDKVSIFSIKLNRFYQRFFNKPQIICIITLVYCSIVNIPMFLSFDAIKQNLNFSDESYTYIAYTYGFTEFGVSNIGSILVYMGYFLRDIFPLVTLIVLNITLIVKLKNHMNKKKINRII